MINLLDIRKAYGIVRDKVYRTPVITNESFNKKTGNEVFLKLENFQKTGAFKIRGVVNKVKSLSEKQKEKGIICATSGNHGLGVGLVSYWERINAIVIVPEITPENKIEKLKHYVNVEIKGESYFESYLYAREKAKKEGLTFIHGFDDPYIIAGQGTVALEIFEDVPDVDCIIAPIGGGGLIAGLLIAGKSLNSKLKVIGVQAKGAPSMFQSWEQGSVVELPEVKTVAEGIAVKKPGELNFEIVNKFIDDIVLVDDEEIKEGMKFLFNECKIVAEGAGASSIAAVRGGKIKDKNKKIVCIITGGNISAEKFSKIILGGAKK